MTSNLILRHGFLRMAHKPISVIQFMVRNKTSTSRLPDSPSETMFSTPSALNKEYHSFNYVSDMKEVLLQEAQHKPMKTDPKRVRILPTITEPNAISWVREDHSTLTPFDDCETIDQVMRKAIKLHANKKTMGFRRILKKDGKKVFLETDLQYMTYKDLDNKLDCLVQGFLSSGIKSGDRVVIFMDTRLEWYLTYQALLRMGSTIATLYATLGDEGVVHGMNEVQATHVITSNELLPKISKLVGDMKYLKTLIVVRDVVDGKREDFTLKEINGLNIFPFEVLEETKGSLPFTPPSKDDIAFLMYTSGSTGAPKAVVHTHSSMMSSFKDMCIYFDQQELSPDGQYICYLPLAHIMENYSSFAFLATGRPFAFGSPSTLLGSSPGLMPGSKCDCVVVKPKVMIGVPLMFDRIRKTIEAVVSSRGSMFKSLFENMMAYKRQQNNAGHSTPLVDRIFVNKTRELFGGNLTTIVSGGAALSPDTQAFIQACLGIDVLIVYGATEAGGATVTHVGDTALGTTGIPYSRIMMKLINWDEGGYRTTDRPHPRGEVVIGGPSISSGYFMKEDKTKESFSTDCNGIKWWSSGDIGELLPDGSLKIVDRKKDLVKLSSGEYISLGKVEAHLKSAPVVDNICVYGTGKDNFLIAIVVPNVAVLKELGMKVGHQFDVFEKLCLDEQVKAAALEQMRSYGEKSGLFKFEIPKKIKLCHEVWTPDSGLVTAALKIRRKQIQDFYMKDIKDMYRES